MEMSEKIRLLRKQKGLTLEQVGNAVGVGKSTVRKWETGDIANMRRDKIAKLANILGCSPAFLMGWDDKQIETSTILSKETLKVAEAYEKADIKEKNIVRQVLDLELID